MLNASIDNGDTTGTPASEPPGRGAGTDRAGVRLLRRWAVISGLLGTILALAIPFLPVRHDIVTLTWPTVHGTKPVSAPLVIYSPVRIDTSVPCASARSLDRRTEGPGTLVSTNPPTSKYGELSGLALQVDDGQLSLLTRGQRLNTVVLPQGECTISVHSDGYRTKATVGSEQIASVQGDVRPQLTGIFSDLDAAKDDVAGLKVRATVDNRFSSQPTVLKAVVIGLMLVAFAASIAALWKLDRVSGRRPPLLAPRGWWKPTFRDGAVYSALGVWWLIGAMTSDDGYILTIARARAEAGYVSNYYRWFANPESPWGWFYELYSLWVQVSTATLWVRLPALVMAVVSWLLISREVLPRLGQKVRRSGAAGWAAAAVFLAFWLPYNNGLRPEPVVVVFSLLALCAVERAIATRRLLPASLGLVGAALAVGANPHGLVAVLPFVAALRPLVRLVRERARTFGLLPVLAPISACGFAILAAVYSDQTWQSVIDGLYLKTEYGPSDDWYQELNRYNMLFSFAPDGSLSRRFPVLLVILCLITCAVVLLRRGRIRGAALGPSRRLLAVTAMSFGVLVLTQTKWTHHFGIFAAVGGALAALTALATSSTVLRSKRNRTLFFAGLMLICALASTGTNGWWYVSGWGVPWFDKPPSLNGWNASSVLLAVALIAAIVALIEHVRLDGKPPVQDQSFEQRSRALRWGTAPLSIICALLVVGEVAAFAKVIHKQAHSYSLGADNIKQITGSSCGLSDYIYVEKDPHEGILQPSPTQPTVAAPGWRVPRANADTERPRDYLGPKQDGFRQPGLPPGDGSDAAEPNWQPPHGFGDQDAPVWGSYEPKGVGLGELRTPWYDLPRGASDGSLPIVVTLAGIEVGANAIVAEFGKDTPQGFKVVQRYQVMQEPAPLWRAARITVNGPSVGANKMRLVATDQALGADGWLALSAPRVPKLTQMTKVIGDDPTFVEWSAALVHPCARISNLHYGIAEMPRFRVAAGDDVREPGVSWSSPDAGGPFGWMNVATTFRELPTYLKGDFLRDWGSLYMVEPQEPDALPASAAMRVTEEVHWGQWTPGPMSAAVELPGDVPSSNDRTDVEGANDAAKEEQNSSGE